MSISMNEYRFFFKETNEYRLFFNKNE